MHAIAIEAAVTFLLLSHPAYSVRERVTPAPHIAVLGVHHSDVEIRHRCHGGADAYRRAAVAAYLDTLPAVYWIDALPADWPNRSDIISSYLGRCAGMVSQAPDYAAYRAAMRLYCVAELDVPTVRRVFATIPSTQHWLSGGNWIKVALVEAAPEPMEEP